MIKYAITELWSNESKIQITGLSVGDLISINEKQDGCTVALALGQLTRPSDIVPMTIPVGLSELERFASIELEWYSNGKRKVFSVANEALQFSKDLRLLVTGFQKTPANEINTIAAVTIAFNEDYMLKKWTNYYGKILGFENIFIIDDGSSVNPKEYLHKDVNVIRQPRTSFDSWRLCRSLSKLQRLLLETYDAVIVLDSDEFLVTNRPDCQNIKDHIQSIFPHKTGIIQTQGWELIHLIDREDALSIDRSISEQRKNLIRNQGFDKPAVTNTEISLTIGNHWCFENKTQDNDLIMLHLRHFDINFSLEKIRKYKSTSWAQIDLANGFSNHQRIEETDLINQFKEYIKTFNEAIHSGKIDVAKNMPEHWANQLEWAG
jgi:hypothetical protein